jgi:hypothetical protein
MAKIDITKIEGYENMTAEEKLKALEEYEVPEADYTGYVKKDVFDKTASELAAKKKELNEKLSEDEKTRNEEQEKLTDLQTKYEALLKESEVSKFKAKLIGLGYEEKLAEETAQAMADGDTAKVFDNQKKHLDSVEKKIKADVLKSTPSPKEGGKADEGMTLDKLRKLSPTEREAWARSNPEDYKQLYTDTTGGNT